MKTIFQQAKFDEKLDDKRCLDVFEEVRDRLKRILYHQRTLAADADVIALE